MRLVFEIWCIKQSYEIIKKDISIYVCTRIETTQNITLEFIDSFLNSMQAQICFEGMFWKEITGNRLLRCPQIKFIL